MSAIIVNGATPFGALSNSAVSKLKQAITDLHRVRLAAAAAISPGPDNTALETGSNFGVVPSATPGEKGGDYMYALSVLDDALQSFAVAYEGQLTALDNGD